MVDDPLRDARWAAVLASWDDDDAHAAFVEHCRHTGALDVAARLYRAQAEMAPPYRDDQTRGARRRLAGIAALAMIELEAKARREDRLAAVLRRRRYVRFSLLVALVAGLVTAVVTKR